MHPALGVAGAAAHEKRAVAPTQATGGAGSDTPFSRALGSALVARQSASRSEFVTIATDFRSRSVKDDFTGCRDIEAPA